LTLKSYTVPVDKCPHCGYKADGVFRRDDGEGGPSPGDFCVCYGCTELLRFTHDMGMEIPSAEHLAELDKEYLAEVEKSKEVVRRSRASKIAKTGGN
jgi:hypothetical protein